MALYVETFGRLHALRDGSELDWLQSQRVRAALFTYLAIERVVQRASLVAVFWPESDEESARHALRQNLYQLRQALGDDWVETHGTELRVADCVSTDAGEFEAAIEREDYEAAARMYAGPFLDGVHPIDLKAWESWVDARRAHLAREFRRACRAWVEACRARGDPTAAIEAAQCWAHPDPLDDEAQHKLIEVLAEAGRRTDALRQYETYARLLEAEDLAPLDETKALVARVEDQGAVGPTAAVVELAAEESGAHAREYLEIFGAGEGRRENRSAVRSRGGRRAWLLALVIAACSGFVVIAAKILTSSASGSFDDPASVLVLPLRAAVPAGDSSAATLMDLERLFITAIQASSRLRAIDGRSAVPTSGGARSTADMLHMAGGIGASYVVEAEVLHFGRTPQLIYTVHDVRTGARLVSGTGRVEESLADAVGRLALEATGAIVAHAEGDVRIGVYGPYGSMAAVLHLLDGQSKLARDDVPGAIDQFAFAVREDSSFGFAYYWLSTAQAQGPSWNHTAALDVVEAGLRRGAELSRAERLLLEAQRHHIRRQADSALASFEALTQVHDEVPEAFLGLGEAIYHYAGYVGRDRSHAMGPFQRAAAAGSEFLPLSTSGHMVELALHAGDTATARTLLPATLRASDDAREWYATTYALTIGDPAERARVLTSLANATGRTLSYVVVHFARAAHDLALADTAAGLLLAARRTSTERALGAGYRLAIAARRGRWEDGLERWLEARIDTRWNRWILAAHFAGLDTRGLAADMLARAEQWRSSGRIPDFRLDPNEELRQGQRALVHEAFVRGDSQRVKTLLSDVTTAMTRAADVSDPLPHMLRGTLEARLGLLRADTAGAILHLERVLRLVAEPRIANFPLTTMAPQRLALADLHLARGDTVSAVEWLDSFWRTSSVGDLFFHIPATQLRQRATRPSSAR